MKNIIKKRLKFDGKEIFTVDTMYNRKVWFSFGDSDYICKRFSVNKGCEDAYAETQPVFDNETQKSGILIRLYDEDSLLAENIAHEAVHAAIDILDEATGNNLKLSYADSVGSESMCYLVDSIIKQIRIAINKI